MAEDESWDLAAPAYDQRLKSTHEFTAKEYVIPEMLEFLGDVRGKKILDLACGQGHFTRILAGKGAQVVGIDISARLLGIARKDEAADPLGIMYIKSDASRLEDVKDRSFDLITVKMGFHSIRDLTAALNECSRVIRPGGHIVFSVVHPLTDTVNNRDYRHDLEGKYLSLRAYGRPRAIAHPGYKKFGVKRYHRPIGYYLNELFEAGFSVTGFKEIPIRHASKLSRYPFFIRPIMHAASAIAPGLFAGLLGPIEVRDLRSLELLKEFPKFLVVEATKKK